MANPSFDRLALAIDRIYAAGCSEVTWTDALTCVAELVGGRAAHFISHDHAEHGGGVLVSVRTDPEALKAYGEHYHALDPWATSPAAPAQPLGQVVPGQALVSHSDIVKTEYYAEFAKPFGLSRMLGCMLALSEQTSTLISMNRADRDKEFDVSEVALLQALVPHLLRALEIRRLVGDVNGHRDAFAEVLDRLELGVVIVDALGHVAFANREARRIAGRRDGLLFDRDGPKCASLDLTNRLRSAMAAVRRPECSGEALLLHRPTGAAPLQLLVMRAHRMPLSGLPEGRGGTVLIVRDPARRQQPDPELLRVYFGLTPTEARFAAAFAHGLDSREIGDRFRLTRSSTRWMVEQLRTKLGVRTQAQVVAALWQSLAHVARRRTAHDQDDQPGHSPKPVI